MAKLTLSVDDRVVVRAKRYAKQHDTSVSQLVEAYLSAVSKPVSVPDTPVLRSIRGILKTGSIADYRKHLVSKYR